MFDFNDIILRTIIKNKEGRHLTSEEYDNVDLFYNDLYHLAFCSPPPEFEAYKGLYTKDSRYHVNRQNYLHKTPYTERFDHDVHVGELRLKEYRKHLGLDKMSVLDVGCSNGGFVKALVDVGIDASGVDTNEEIIKLAKKFIGQRVLVHDFEISDQPLDRKYQCFTIHDVIEHLYYPCRFLRNLAKSAEEEFYLVLDTPDLEQGMRGNISTWKHLWGTDHQVLFNSKSLDILVQSVFPKAQVIASYEPIPDKIVKIFSVKQ